MELKTLKDLPNSEVICSCDKVNHFLYLKEDLKQEAIKWIEYTQEHFNKSNDEIHKHKDLAVISWIAMFFNIKEGDLE